MSGFEGYVPTQEDLNSVLGSDELSALRAEIRTGYGDESTTLDKPMAKTPFDDSRQEVEGAEQ